MLAPHRREGHIEKFDALIRKYVQIHKYGMA